MDTPSLLSAQETEICARFVDEGHVILPADDPAALIAIRQSAAQLAAAHLGVAVGSDAGRFLDSIHERVDAARLNALRLAVFQGLNADPAFRRRYYELGRRSLEILVGNELAMQRNVNLSVQLPNDDSSLLPVHVDVWSGDSPFEVVLWVPLVDCFATKSMFLLPPAADREMQSRLAEFSGQTAEELYARIADKVRFLDVPFGSVLLFSQNLMHGNRVNLESTTRWSMNCRFKAVLAPYGDKRIGEFFEPLILRPATRLGMEYKLPQGFRD